VFPNEQTLQLYFDVFSKLKKLIKLHQGLAKKRKIKLIDEFLSSYNKRQ